MRNWLLLKHSGSSVWVLDVNVVFVKGTGLATLETGALYAQNGYITGVDFTSYGVMCFYVSECRTEPSVNIHQGC